ncbi:MAG: response regulator [Sphingobacteriales bacterium]|nr:MAG: response regulator [Sphingobacteriales bacterium]
MEHGTRVPIIAFTAGNVLSERDAALAAGMDHFVVKPVVEEMNATVFNKWLHLKANAD